MSKERRIITLKKIIRTGVAAATVVGLAACGETNKTGEPAPVVINGPSRPYPSIYYLGDITLTGPCEFDPVTGTFRRTRFERRAELYFQNNHLWEPQVIVRHLGPDAYNCTPSANNPKP